MIIMFIYDLQQQDALKRQFDQTVISRLKPYLAQFNG